MWAIALALIGIAVLATVLTPNHAHLTNAVTLSEATYTLTMGSKVVHPDDECLRGGSCRLALVAELMGCTYLVDSWGRPVAVANVSMSVVVRPGPGYPWRPVIAPSVRVEGGSLFQEVHVFAVNGSYVGGYYLVSSGSTLIYAASLAGETHIVELVVNC